MAKLTQEEIMAIKQTGQKDISNRKLARLYGIDESTVRYHVARGNTTDGRKNKPQKADQLAQVISHWLGHNKPEPGRKPNARALWEYLVDGYSYAGSYRSVVRYLDRNLPPAPLRPRRRVETPPGIQAQADWGSFNLNICGRLVALCAFVLTFSHSRGFAVVWSKQQDMLSWINCHNRAFWFLGGVPHVIRIDNLKTGVASGAGPTARIHPTYAAYARELRFVVDPARAYTPTDKGKVEAKVKLARRGLRPEQQQFASMDELERWTDDAVIRRMRLLTNPLTGTTVHEAWQAERETLQALPPFAPVPFDVVVARRVAGDCLVSFEGRRYSVPFALVSRTVEVRGASGAVLVYSDGVLIAEHPRHTKRRLLINPAHYEGAPTDTVTPPVPLGRLTRHIMNLWDIPVAQRPLDLYEQLLAVRHGGN